jgi:hypothetical protein
MAKPGKGAWEMFYKRVWHTRSFRALGTDARLLYLWSWTSPGDGRLSGLFEASPTQLAQALGDADSLFGPRQRVAAALRELAVKPLLLYDDDAEVVWVVGRVEHALRSPTQAVRMRREFEACPPSPLRDRFRATYGAQLQIEEVPTT